MAIPYSYDRWIAPTEVEDSANVVEGGAGTATVTAQTYWPYFAPEVTGYPALFTSLSAALTTACGVAVSLEAASPTTSPQAPLTGLRLRASAAFSLSFSSPSFTLDPRLLGFGAGQSTDVASVVQGSDHVITSPFGIWPVWVVPRVASAKLADVRHEQYGAEGSRYRWRTRNTRTIEYQSLPAAAVRRTRAAESSVWAKNAGLGYEDVHGNYQVVWDEGLSKGLDVILVHNEGRQDLMVTSHPYEVVRIPLTEDAASRFSAVVTDLERQRGELYDIAIPIEVLSGTYEHS